MTFRNLIRTMLFALLAVTVAQPVSAGDPCAQDMTSSACDVFLRQQSAPGTNPQSDGLPVRCAWVTAAQASALVLREGKGSEGPVILSWRLKNLNWTNRKINGHDSLMTQICFRTTLLYKYEVVSLCGADGHSVWRNANMSYVRENDVGRFDPACVGGKGWCNWRGL